jgi:hypothetical protein
MSDINNGGPAYPIMATETHDTWPGMSLRDAAGLAALQGFCSQTDSSGTWSWLPDMAAAEAWRVADAFIAARETKEGEE